MIIKENQIRKYHLIGNQFFKKKLDIKIYCVLEINLLHSDFYVGNKK